MGPPNGIDRLTAHQTSPRQIGFPILLMQINISYAE